MKSCKAVADPLPARRELGWQARVSLTVGLATTIDWHRRQKNRPAGGG